MGIDPFHCCDMHVAVLESHDMWKVDVKLDSSMRLWCTMMMRFA
jgi:hypothetical protein